MSRLHATAPRDDLDIRVAALPELIPPGQYDAQGVGGWRKFVVFKVTKLAVELDVLVPDPDVEIGHRRVRLERFYNVRPAPDRRIQASKWGAYLREWMLAANRRPSRHDRLSPRVFTNVLFRVEVATVTQNGKHDPLHELSHYSVVRRIIERLAGGAAL